MQTRHTSARPRTKEQKALARGMAIALADIARHGCCQQGAIKDALANAGLDLETLRAVEVDDYDLQVLRSHL